MGLTDWSESIVIVALGDEPAFSDDMSMLLSRLNHDARTELHDVPDVVLDFRGVTYLNSSNLAQLLRLRKKLAQYDRRLRLCSVSDPVWSVMLTTGLDGIFTFTEDVSTSLASLQMR